MWVRISSAWKMVEIKVNENKIGFIQHAFANTTPQYGSQEHGCWKGGGLFYSNNRDKKWFGASIQDRSGPQGDWQGDGSSALPLQGEPHYFSTALSWPFHQLQTAYSVLKNNRSLSICPHFQEQCNFKI